MLSEVKSGLHINSVFSNVETRDAIEEFFQNKSTYLEAPACIFWGTQEIGEYDKEKEKATRRSLRERGIDFLRENPTYSVLVPGSRGTIIAVLDGHHKTRYAPAYGINIIPTLITEIPPLAAVLEQDSEKLASWISVAAGIAYESFSRRRDTLIQHPPYLDKNIQSVDQLTNIRNINLVSRPLRECSHINTRAIYTPGSYATQIAFA